MMRNLRQLQIILACACASGLATSQSALANPTGASVVNGDVSFAQPALATLEISNSPGAIINWQRFDIDAGEVTRFIQQSDSSAVLNRVVSGDASEILGSLESNGSVFLVNPNGLLIGQGASIDTAGFIASTLNISDDDFLNGRLHFEGENAGALENHGAIRVGAGGDILLIAPGITNGGVLQVDGGNILLAAGESVTISSVDDARIGFQVQSPDNSVTNLGDIIANDGAASIFAGTLTHSGSISANAVTRDEAGRIRLVAGDTAWIEGHVSATGKRGGDIRLLGEQVGIAGQAVIDASGQNGGGEILVGGDYQGQGDVQTARATFVGEGVQIKADAIKNGDGGRVVVWADESTRMYGSIFARGGAVSGNGGFVETSGGFLDIGVNVPDVGAANGDGGTWLLDPNNITIVGVGAVDTNIDTGTTGFFASFDDGALLRVGTLQTALSIGDVIIQTSTAGANGEAGDIVWEVGANLDLTGLGNGKTLTLNAHNDVIINSDIGNFTNAINEDINLTINADFDGNGQGGFTLGNGSSLFLAEGSGVGKLDVRASSDIRLDGAVNTGASGAGAVSLFTSGGRVLQAASSNLSTGNLLTSSLGDTSLIGSNTLGSFSGKVGAGANLQLINGSALTLGEIGSTSGNIRIESTDLAVGSAILSEGNINLVATNSLSIDNSVQSSGANVQIESAGFQLGNRVSAKNRVIVRGTGSLAVDDSGTAAGTVLTSTDLSLLSAGVGIELGANAVAGAPLVEILSAIDSGRINAPTLILDTGAGGSVLVASTMDFSAGNENLVFAGSGAVDILSTVNTGNGSLLSSAGQLRIAAQNGPVLVKTGNARIDGDLIVESGSTGGSALFRGNHLTLTNGNVQVSALGGGAAIDFTGLVDIRSATGVSLTGGIDNAGAAIRGGNVSIVSAGLSLSGGSGNNAGAVIASRVDGSTIVVAADISLLAGTGIDSDAVLVAGGGLGPIGLSYANCAGCARLLGNPIGNGQTDTGVFAGMALVNGSIVGPNLVRLDASSDLRRLYENFTRRYVQRTAMLKRKRAELICR